MLLGQAISKEDSKNLMEYNSLTMWKYNEEYLNLLNSQVGSSTSSDEDDEYFQIHIITIDFLPEEFAGELDFIDPILPRIDEDDCDEDYFDDKEEEIDIFQIKDEILREKLLNVNLLVDKIEALKLTPSILYSCGSKTSLLPIPLWIDCPDFEDSRARCFVHPSLSLQSFACLYWEFDILNLID
ncbi:hypothetical protein Tco_0114967 [Tanacetum coccineum]